MKRPSLQFYPADWKNNTNLRRCSEAARGAWMDVLCALHDSDEYGVCRWPLADLARSAGVPIRLLKELADKKVLKGGDEAFEAFVHTPFHAGKEGKPVTLIAAGDGPCWYSSRLVRDEWVRGRRGEGTRFDSENQPSKPSPTRSPTRRVGDGSGDGPSSSSSSSSSSSKEEREPTPRVHEPNASLPLIFEEWNRTEGISQCLLMSDKRRNSLKVRLGERFFADNWKAALVKVAQSSFCRGVNERGWKASFDWFISRDAVTKIMEGKYDDRNGQTVKPNTRNPARKNGTDYGNSKPRLQRQLEEKARLDSEMAALGNASPQVESSQ